MFSELMDMNRSLPCGLGGTCGDGIFFLVGTASVVDLAAGGGSTDSEWIHSMRGDGVIGAGVCLDIGQLLDDVVGAGGVALVVPPSCLYRHLPP